MPIDIVTRMVIARQQLGKHILKVYGLNRKSIARLTDH
jgi:hypothetical protein